MNKKGNYIAAGVVIVLLLTLGISIHSYNSQRMEGSYTAKINMFFFTEKDNITFSKDKTFIEGSTDLKKSERNKGTYEISGNKLNLKWNKGGYKAKCILSKNRKSFYIKSANGALSVAQGIKFKKDNE